MSTVDPRHERLEELIAIDAVGGLDATDGAELAAALAEHGPDCPGCAALLAGYGEAATTLAIGLAPVAMSAGAEDRLIAAARRRDADATVDAQAGRPELSAIPGSAQEPGAVERASRGRERRGSAGRWVAAAAVAAALAFGLVAGFIAAPKAPEGTKAFLAFAAQPGTRFAAFPTDDGQHLTVAYRPGETNAWIFGSGLMKPAGGQTYELWWGADGTPLEQMNAAGLFVPIHGDVIAPVTIGSSDPGTVLGVTIEPPGGSPRPTTKPVFATSV